MRATSTQCIDISVGATSLPEKTKLFKINISVHSASIKLSKQAHFKRFEHRVMAIVETSFPRGGVVRSKAKEAEIVSCCSDISNA